MRKNILILIALIFIGFGANAQTLQELREDKAEKEQMIEEYENSIKEVRTSLESIQRDIDLLSGWRTGINGLVGFKLSNSDNWIGSANPDAQSSSLNFSLIGYADYDQPKYFWDNKLTVVQEWLKIDKNDGSVEEVDNDLFDNGVTDILNLSSLGGYKVNERFAITGLGELHTSVNNFLEPGVLDIGIGGTYIPNDYLKIVFHPINMHTIWFSENVKELTTDVDNPNVTLGAKLRADYTQNFNILEKRVAFSSTFTAFMPYSEDDISYPETNADGTPTGEIVELGAGEWTWLNNASFEVWKGIGVGVGFGLRDASAESDDLQKYYTLGLSYGF